MKKLDFYYIDLKYIRDLSRKDDNVMSISPQRGKQNRPFVGVVVMTNERKYCIPLTSPKDKFKNRKSQVDFIKVYDEESAVQPDGSHKLIGVLNINNMIPVTDGVIKRIDMKIRPSDSQETQNMKRLMQKQVKWCRNHVETIENRANKVYDLVTKTPEKSRNLVRRSSDFIKLEKIADEYEQKEIKND